MRTLLPLLLSLTLALTHALNPVVFFPGYSFSKLNVVVSNGIIGDCPANGEYVVQFGYETNQGGFDEGCMLYYLNLTYNPNGQTGRKFASRQDVTVTIPGREEGDVTQCVGGGNSTGSYNEFFDHLTANGYTTGPMSSGATLLAACFDWRLDPTNDVIEGPSYMDNTQAVIESAYNNAQQQKVWLVAHSNGPLMALYFLNHMDEEWKNKYIAGFIPLSGNFAGQGVFLSVLLGGISLRDFNFNPNTAPIMQFWSSNLFSLAQPDIFAKSDINLLTTLDDSRKYNVSAGSYDYIFSHANLNFALEHWRDFEGLSSVNNPPGVYTYAFWGAGFETIVGIEVQNFDDLSILNLILAQGDVNQEAVDNEAVKVWSKTTPNGCFEYEEVVGVDHFKLTGDEYVRSKILTIINKGVPSVQCAQGSDAASFQANIFVVLTILGTVLLL